MSRIFDVGCTLDAEVFLRWEERKKNVQCPDSEGGGLTPWK